MQKGPDRQHQEAADLGSTLHGADTRSRLRRARAAAAVVRVHAGRISPFGVIRQHGRVFQQRHAIQWQEFKRVWEDELCARTVAGAVGAIAVQQLHNHGRHGLSWSLCWVCEAIAQRAVHTNASNGRDNGVEVTVSEDDIMTRRALHSQIVHTDPSLQGRGVGWVPLTPIFPMRGIAFGFSLTSAFTICLRCHHHFPR